MKILVVDDEVDGRLLLALMFGERHQIVEAENGTAALERLASNTGSPVQAILLDGQMPMMDGATFLHERAKTRFADIPLAIYSGLGRGLQEVASEFGVSLIVKDGRIDAVESFLARAALH
jgi:CheY-like chemotaxis protein